MERGEFLIRRRQAYVQTFDTVPGKKVMADLKRFCKATSSSYVPGDRDAVLINEGRREVFYRISGFLNISAAEIWQLTEIENEDGG